jgi:hypothetical protein
VHNRSSLAASTTTFRYKGFDLNVFMQFQYGNDVVNAARRGLENMQDHTNQSIALHAAGESKVM